MNFRLCLVLLACVALCRAQDPAAECLQAKTDLEAQLAQANDALGSWQRSHEQLQADVTRLQAEVQQRDVEVVRLKRQADAETRAQEDRLAQLRANEHAQLEQAKADCVDGMQQLQKDFAHQVSELQAQCKKDSAQSSGDALSLLMKAVSDKASAAVDVLKIVFAELQQGNTTTVTLLAQQASAYVASSAGAAHALLLRELDEHLPFVKQHVVEARAKLDALYQKHVANATWAAELTKHISTANVELKAFVSKQIRAQPALASLDDPVYIQLIAYAVIGAPLAFVLLLPVLLWVGALFTPSGSKDDAASKNGKKKAKKSKPAGGPKPKA